MDEAEARAERIARYLEENGLASAVTQVVPLSGDASDRRYFRVVRPGRASVVLALHAGPIELATLPFANVGRLLQRLQLPVPAILGHSDALGILALDDLGDTTLQASLGAATAPERTARYREAVGLIHALQRRAAEVEPDGYLPYRLAFDVEKLTWELEFFRQQFLEKFRGAALSAPQRAALSEEFLSVAAELSEEPRVLCHRDYHSRNLMLHDGSLFMIDYQDARMGPDTYDLASLLRDSYVELPHDEMTRLIACFLELGGVPARTSPEEFRRRFDLMAIQRNLKALGTFGYQTVAKNNPVYRESMPRTLGYVRANLAAYPRFARLRELLAAHLEELR